MLLRAELTGLPVDSKAQAAAGKHSSHRAQPGRTRQRQPAARAATAHGSALTTATIISDSVIEDSVISQTLTSCAHHAAIAGNPTFASRAMHSLWHTAGGVAQDDERALNRWARVPGRCSR